MATIMQASEAQALDQETLEKLLERDEVVGLGETYWAQVIKGDDRIKALFAKTLAKGKKIEGHSAGARGNRLVSYIAAGVSSCHEPTTVEEVVERLRLGTYTMIREGDLRKDLEVISKIKDEPIDLRRLVLVTDGVGPQTLMRKGCMEFVVQRAIDLGFSPIVAVQMATLNPAEHFAMDNVMGGIAPGKYADIVIIPELQTIKAEYVISNGKIIVHKGELMVEPQKPRFSKTISRSLRIDRRLNAGDFAIRTGGRDNSVRVRVMDLVTDLVSRESQIDMVTSNGEIKGDVGRDILKVAVITNGDRGLRVFVGVVKGFGIRKGALATSAAWDACALIVVGANEEDMAAAANRVIALRGGAVLCADGQIQAELALPIGGLMSDQPLEVLVNALENIQQETAELGSRLSDPLMTLCILTTPAIPFVRISDEGLVDIKENKIVDLIIR